MGRMFSLVAAVGILGSATVAFAGDKIYTTSGKVKSVDLMRHIVTLESGSAYKAARGVNIKNLKTGQKITLTYSAFGGSVEASTITAAID
jgi:Protein of unknown function (DUF1344)